MKKTHFWLSIVSLITASTSAHAEFLLGAGVAEYLNPQKGLDAKTLAFPMISYTGDRLSFQFTTLSYRLASFGDVEINALASVRSQGYNSNDSDYLQGMKDREDTLDGGLGLNWKGIRLSISHDMLSTHKGSEVSLSYNHGFDLGKLQLSIGGGVNWQSKELTNYYYGVNTSEAKILTVNNKTFFRIAYQVKSDCIPKANMFMRYALTDSWSLISGAEINFLPNNISDSPIVDSNISWGAFAGIAHSF